MLPLMEATTQSDQDLLDAVPAFLSVGSMLKATPAIEGTGRFVYIEASNEMRDQQNEVVLAKALADSADYYLKFGNIDIDHYTCIGAKMGIPDYLAFEIGVPVDVRIEDGRTFVKGHIKSGEGPAAVKANLFWSSLTDVSPPERWYPSVGGAVTGKEVVIGDDGSRHAVITKVRWSNLAVSRTPVNANVPTVSTAAFGPLAKSWCAAMYKGLEAGGGSDVAMLTGGAAMRQQSLDRQLMSYWDFRDQFSNAISNGEVKQMTQPGMVQAAQERFELSPAQAAEYVEQFLLDLQRALKEKQ